VISLISTRQVARVPAAVLALVASAALAGCGGESGPVARVSVEPDAVELAYPATARLTTSWEMTVPLDAEGRPVVFVHLIGAEGEVDRTFDFPLTVEWRPGETATVPLPLWQSALGPPLAPGSYRLTLGLYDSAAGRRGPLATAGEEVARQEYEVARVEVPEPGRGPAVVFTGGWLEVEPTGDRQELASRWLREDGGIEVSALGGPTTLALELETPRPGETEARRVLDEGAERPELTVSSSCAAAPATVTEPGIQRVELRLEPAPGGDGVCEVAFDANFIYLDRGSFERRTLALKRLTLTPAEAGAPATPAAEPPGEPDTEPNTEPDNEPDAEPAAEADAPPAR
jgi:hypothetical protein